MTDDEPSTAAPETCSSVHRCVMALAKVAPCRAPVTSSRALVDAFEAALKVVRSLGFSPSDVADVLQQASIRAWRHRDQRRGDFRPWFSPSPTAKPDDRGGSKSCSRFDAKPGSQTCRLARESVRFGGLRWPLQGAFPRSMRS